MKHLLILLIAFISLSASAFAQRQIQQTKYTNGTVSNVSYHNVPDTAKIDLYYFTAHYYKPYHVPERFIEQAYRDTIISIWGNDNPHSMENNWQNSYYYDRQSRLYRYTYSACLICSSMAYDYTVTYTSTGQIESITNMINMKDAYRFRYTASGELQAMDIYSLDRLESTLAVVR